MAEESSVEVYWEAQVLGNEGSKQHQITRINMQEKPTRSLDLLQHQEYWKENQYDLWSLYPRSNESIILEASGSNVLQ